MPRARAQPSCSSVRNRAGHKNRTSMENIVPFRGRTPTTRCPAERPNPNDEIGDSQRNVTVAGPRAAGLRGTRIDWSDPARLAGYCLQWRVVRDRSPFGERNFLASLQWPLAGILPARNDRGRLCLPRLRQRWLDGYLSGQRGEM